MQCINKVVLIGLYMQYHVSGNATFQTRLVYTPTTFSHKLNMYFPQDTNKDRSITFPGFAVLLLLRGTYSD